MTEQTGATAQTGRQGTDGGPGDAVGSVAGPDPDRTQALSMDDVEREAGGAGTGAAGRHQAAEHSDEDGPGWRTATPPVDALTADDALAPGSSRASAAAGDARSSPDDDEGATRATAGESAPSGSAAGTGAASGVSAAAARTTVPTEAGRATAGVRTPGGPRPPGASRSGPSPRAAASSGRQRRARLRLRSIDPWSVFVLSLLISLFLAVVQVVAVVALYAVLQSAGVPESINALYAEVTRAPGGEEPGPLLSAGRALTAAGVLAVVNVVLFTALSTLSAVLYNVCAAFTGGVEVTLAEHDS